MFACLELFHLHDEVRQEPQWGWMHLSHGIVSFFFSFPGIPLAP